MDQKNKNSKKAKRSKIAYKQPRGQASGVRREPHQSPLHNYKDIYAGLSTYSPNSRKSPRTWEDIFTQRANFWNTNSPIRGFTPTGSSSSIPSTPATPMRDYENPIDLRVNQGISPNFANDLLQQIVVHGETISFPSTSNEGLTERDEAAIEVEYETANNY